MKHKKTTSRLSIKTYNNKSRKGEYLKIQIGSKVGLYKMPNDGRFAPLVRHFEDKITNKLKGSLTAYKKGFQQTLEGKKRHIRYKQLEKIIKRSPKLGDMIKKGVTYNVIEKAYLVAQQPNLAKREYNKLLRTLVLDKKILNILTQPENIQKMKTRFEYMIEYQDEKGKTLFKATAINKTLEEVLRACANAGRKGEDIIKEERYRIMAELLKSGIKGDMVGTGKIDNMRVTMIFRKG